MELRRSRLFLQSPLNDRLQQFILQSRQKAGMSQRELASKLGVRQTMVARIEQGNRSVDLGEFVAICRLLGENPSEVLTSLLSHDPSAADAKE
ncbi:helix-turn-helix domain-containing protein [Fimbriimonas ginsengisoli]|uniref:helix-turn-helix domain-containing protein n=1 Tax=Fimbriimonas ginsengisoli TaxID=1005039 RepID=UPI00046D2234|nr:helix-turn-helix transcriptional regulator [Fimbriimonas ginsengisoli]